jgi:long-chain acyl-CoA synthetase
MLKSPFIEEILVVRGHSVRTGDEEVQAILYPNFDELKRNLLNDGIPSPNDEDIRRVIQKEIDERGRRLAAYKRITRFAIRSEEFPKTTTNKIKRYLFEKQDLFKK